MVVVVGPALGWEERKTERVEAPPPPPDAADAMSASAPALFLGLFISA